MDFFGALFYFGSVTLLFVLYFILFNEKRKDGSLYTKPAWYYTLKYIVARLSMRLCKKRQTSPLDDSAATEQPRPGLRNGWDSMSFRATAPDGSCVLLSMRHHFRWQKFAEIVVRVILPDGTNYSLERHPDTFVGAPSEDGPWSAGGLKFILLEPYKRWRVLFNGMLLRDGESQPQHVRLNFIWTAASAPNRHPEDWTDEMASRSLAREHWRNQDWIHAIDSVGTGSVMQWGMMQGQVHTEGDSVSVHARGVREHSWAPNSYCGLQRSVSLLATCIDGTAVNLQAASYRKSLSHAVWGSIRFPNGDVLPMTYSDLNLEEFCVSENETTPTYTTEVAAKSRTVKVVMDCLNKLSCKVMSGSPYELETVIVSLKVTLSGCCGHGVLELGYEHNGVGELMVRGMPAPRLRWSELDEELESSCVFMREPDAACPQLVGAKGASLALLATVQEEEGYKVPPFFCLTTHALSRQLDANPELRRAIQDLEAANLNYEEAAFKHKCSVVVQKFANTPIEDSVRGEILSQLQYLRKVVSEQNELHDVCFAVRSSAIGEDSEALSAAGQNETILGCRCDEDVLRAVQRCWGSFFAFISAYYRRMNGMGCVTGGGVVVQAAVQARAAGVLFTRHPEAGDPSRVLITANYGLGETVVSGQVDPDTIILSRDENDDVKILSKQLGTKLSLIALTDKGTETREVSESERTSACISDEECLMLGRLAVRQEALWGAPRDIEWAVYKNEIWLLQARPITSLERWTEFELLHEYDCPVMSEEDLFSFANTGEVMPGPLTTLTYEFVTGAIKSGTYEYMYRSPPPKYFFTPGMVMSHNRLAINMYTTMYMRPPESVDISLRALEVSIHGHPVADDRILAIARKRNKGSAFDKLTVIKDMIVTRLNAGKYLQESNNSLAQFHIEEAVTDDPLKLLEEIENSLVVFRNLSKTHVLTTAASTFTQVILVNILAGKAKEFSMEHCMDVSTMLSSCTDVVSAEVPAALASIAKALHLSGRHAEFKALATDQCLPWLRTNCPDIHDQVQKFLKDQAHRSIKEFELATKTWGLDPSELLASLQAASKPDEEVKKVRTDAEIVSALVSPSNNVARRILRWLLPLCRKGVGIRENTKANLIMGVHKIRLAVRKLGQLMVRDWLLPDPDLVFYFSSKELKDYIQTRDPVLIKKASQRRQFHPKWNKQQFKEMNEGYMKPMDEARPVGGGAQLTGTPVCAGEVLGRACVVRHLSEIDQLRQGDILITLSTDIGWSPYFPLLGGVVTELGGLISHGAVIAREYGLPCIVGAMGATNFCKTGDTVLLVGSTGLLQLMDHKMEPEQADEKKTEQS